MDKLENRLLDDTNALFGLLWSIKWAKGEEWIEENLEYRIQDILESVLFNAIDEDTFTAIRYIKGFAIRCISRNFFKRFRLICRLRLTKYRLDKLLKLRNGLSDVRR